MWIKFDYVRVNLDPTGRDFIDGVLNMRGSGEGEGSGTGNDAVP
jgi:hypothetical protein